MKRVLIFVIFMPLFCFGCGCWDAPAADLGAESVNKSFDSADEIGGGFLSEIKKQTDEIIALEEINNENIYNTIKLSSLNLYTHKEILFLYKKKTKIIGITND